MPPVIDEPFTEGVAVAQIVAVPIRQALGVAGVGQRPSGDDLASLGINVGPLIVLVLLFLVRALTLRLCGLVAGFERLAKVLPALGFT